MLVLKILGKEAYKDNIKATFWIGEENQTKQNMGSLCFHTGEWQIIMAALSLGTKQVNFNYPRLKVEIDDPLSVRKEKD